MSTLLDRESDRVTVRSADELVIAVPGTSLPRFSGVLAALGLLTMAVAVATLAGFDQPEGRPPAATPAAALGEVSAGGREGALGSHEAITSYMPGQSSGLHSHPGLHHGLVLEGTLTVYDEACSRLIFNPGQYYLGGDDVHLARNETDTAVEMAVTYMPNAGADLHNFPVDEPVPTGCWRP